MAIYASSTSAVDIGGATTITAVHPDVLLTNILTRLDGPTLASASCASSELHSLSNEQNLWRNICHATWPSTNHPRINQIISDFPNGPRSFFSDSFPFIISHAHPHAQNLHPSSSPLELISAVDLHYGNNLIFSKVQETETLTSWFHCSPFRIDLLDPKDVVPTPVQHSEDMCRNFAEELKLSWLIIDPTARRSANLSSLKPVSVQQHWLSGEIKVRFASVVGGDRRTTEFVQCGIVVTLWGCEGGEMQVREVSLQVEDMNGIHFNGKDSLRILLRAIKSGKRKRGRREEGQERYEEYLKMKKEKKERELRREKRLDTLCIVFGIPIFAAFWMFVLLG